MRKRNRKGKNQNGKRGRNKKEGQQNFKGMIISGQCRLQKASCLCKMPLK
jgi:hypothetical protein